MRVSEKTGDEWWKDKAATNKMYLRLWNPRLDVVVPYLWTCVYRTEYVQFVRYGRYWRWMKAIILLRFRTFFYDYSLQFVVVVVVTELFSLSIVRCAPIHFCIGVFLSIVVVLMFSCRYQTQMLLFFLSRWNVNKSTCIQKFFLREKKWRKPECSFFYEKSADGKKHIASNVNFFSWL